MNAIVLTFDCLPEGFLGCCGSSWMQTPNFDKLAAQSALFTQHFAEHVAPVTDRHAWWTGRYQSQDHAAGESENLLQGLAGRGLAVRLLLETTTESISPETAFPAHLSEVLTGLDGLDVPAESTPFFRLVSRAHRDLRLLQTSRKEPWLLWLKSRGVPDPWLARRKFAARFLEIGDEGDGRGEADDEPEGDDPFVEMSPSEFDALLTSVAALPLGPPDREALSDLYFGLIRKVFGGYVALLDEGLGRLLDAVDQAAASSPTLLIVTAANGADVRGASRHAQSEPLSEEMVHTPLFIRSNAISGGIRRKSLVQPVDILPTLLSWFGLPSPDIELQGDDLLPTALGDDGRPRHFAFSSDGKRFSAVRTSDYYLVAERPEPGAVQAAPRLFLKPEDTWDSNDVAAQFPEIVVELSSELDRFFAKTEPGE